MIKNCICVSIENNEMSLQVSEIDATPRSRFDS